MNVMTIILVLYLVGILVLGVIGYQNQRKSNDAENFISANQANSWPTISSTMFGMLVGASAIVGVVTDAYTAGFFIFLYILFRCLNYVFIGIIGGRQIRRAKDASAAAYYSALFGRSAGLIYGVLNGFVASALISITIMGNGNLFPVMTNIDYKTGMIISLAIYLVLSLTGGIRSADSTNKLNTVVMLGGTLLMAILCVIQAGGPIQLYNDAVVAGGEIFRIGNISGKPGIIAAAYALSLPFASACSGPEAVATHSAKSDKDAILGPVFGGLLYIPLSLFVIIVGYYAIVYFPGEDAGGIFYTVASNINPVVGGLAVAGIFAANLSTATGLALGAASMWGWCVDESLKMTGKKALNNKQRLWSMRLIMLIAYAVGYIVATKATSMLEMGVNIVTMLACASFIWYFVLYFPNLFRKSSFLFIIGFSVIGALAYMMIPTVSAFFQHIIYPQLILGVIGWGAALLVDKRPVDLGMLYSEETKSAFTPSERRFFLREKH